MNHVLLTTVFTGYNYGSSLQAFAGKSILEELGFECSLVARKSLVKGRDIRLGKIITILWRSLALSRKKGKALIRNYQSSYVKEMIGDSKNRFNRFTEDRLKPKYMTWRELKNAARDSLASFAGSDQIWNSSSLYVDPVYYLRFAPCEKRVALAPSFGRDFIADYNKKIIGRWVKDFHALSVREDSGVRLIKELIGREACHLIDPTLMISGDVWREKFGVPSRKEKYILAYFLDKPSELALKAIYVLKDYLNCDVIGIPYRFEDMSYCTKMVPTGPVEFIDLVANAQYVLTDSFHGTAFSLNLHVPFYVFTRSYGNSHSQSSRVESLLKMTGMTQRLDAEVSIADMNNLDFDHSETVLERERRKGREYILKSVSKSEL